MAWLNVTAVGTCPFPSLFLPAYKSQISLICAATEDLFKFVRNKKPLGIVIAKKTSKEKILCQDTLYIELAVLALDLPFNSQNIYKHLLWYEMIFVWWVLWRRKHYSTCLPWLIQSSHSWLSVLLCTAQMPLMTFWVELQDRKMPTNKSHLSNVSVLSALALAVFELVTVYIAQL